MTAPPFPFRADQQPETGKGNVMSFKIKAKKYKAVAKHKLKNMTLEEHLKDVLGRVRAEFEKTGEVGAAFECVAENGELITIPIAWKSSEEKYASFGPLKDTFRRRGVRRYVFMNEVWQSKSKNKDFKGAPRDDPNRTEAVMVSGVERNGPRKEFVADIKRQGTKATLGPWETIDRSDPESSSSWWGLELMEEGYSDRPKVAEPTMGPQEIATQADIEDLLDEHPNAAKDMQSVMEVSEGLWDLLCQLHQGKNDDVLGDQFWAGFEKITAIVIEGLYQFPNAPKMKSLAQFLRDHPDRHPMFASVPSFVHPSEQQRDRYGLALGGFLNEMGKQGHSELAVLDAVINVFIRVGIIGMGALRLADFIDDKLADPKQLSEIIRQMHGETENKAA